jgi:limonene-1,2-epoxide hydrolase
MDFNHSARTRPEGGSMKMLIVCALILSVTFSAMSSGASVNNPDIKKFFNEFGSNNIDLADSFYAEDIVFEDPLGKITGLKNIKDYYRNLYKNVTSIRFDFESVVTQGDEQVGIWTMHLKASGLNGGNEVVVKGNSFVRYKNGKAVYHRDYFDMGEFIYDHIPVLKQILGFIKQKLKH